MVSVARGWLLLRLAWRSLYSHGVKSAIVGTLLMFGTLLVVLGTSLVDSIEHAMQRSITASLAGHLQVYSANGRDRLSLFGSGFMGGDDYGRIDEFQALSDVATAVPNVRAVVPMGLNIASITAPGGLERALAALRAAVRASRPDDVRVLAAQVRERLQIEKAEVAKAEAISSKKEEFEERRADLDRATSDAFWAEFDTDPIGALEFLDTRVAAQTEEGRLLYFRYVGTDLDLFEKHFDRMTMVKGRKVPPRTRGIMINDRWYERLLKHFVARNLDSMRDRIRDEGVTIAEDPLLQTKVRQLRRQYQRITFQLNPADARTLHDELRVFMPEQPADADLADRVQAFLTLDDDNFDERYAFFYEHIADKVTLYDIDVGDIITIRGYTQSGFLKAVNVKFFGTFRFEGLEQSNLAAGHSLTDLLTFRELYGLMTDAKKAELEKIRAELGIEDVDAGEAEEALFGEDATLETAPTREGNFDEFADVALLDADARNRMVATAQFPAGAVEGGLALNAAVVLEDPSRIAETADALRTRFEAAGLEMEVVDWQAAAGIIGQFIVLIRMVLYIAIVIIFAVALVIINNTMVMTTMERVTEIGTLRAIGAQRSFIIGMFVLETLVLAVTFGAIGAGLGWAIGTYWGFAGLAAPQPTVLFAVRRAVPLPRGRSGPSFDWAGRHTDRQRSFDLLSRLSRCPSPARDGDAR